MSENANAPAMAAPEQQTAQTTQAATDQKPNVVTAQSKEGLTGLIQDEGLPDFSEMDEDQIGQLFDAQHEGGKSEQKQPQDDAPANADTQPDPNAAEQPGKEEAKAPDTQPGQPVEKAVFKLFGEDKEVSAPQLEQAFRRLGELEQMASSPEGRTLIKNAEPLLEIYNALQNDPGLREYLQRYPQHKQAQDPGSALRQNLAQETARMLEPKIQAQQEALRTMQVENAKSTFMADPDFQEVRQLIAAGLNQDLTSGRISYQQANELYQRLDGDPVVFGQAFRHFKAQLTAKRQQEAIQARGMEKAEAEQIKTAMEQSAFSKKRAPVLESGNAPASMDDEYVKQQRNFQRALQGDEHAIGMLFQ